MRGLQFHENMIENQLARHGVQMGDVRFVCHTHLHIDHAGKDDLFPMNTTVVAQSPRARIFRLRLDASAISETRYQASDRPPAHQRRAALPGPRIVGADRADARRAIARLRMPIPRVDEHACQTAEGHATICGDVIYDFQRPDRRALSHQITSEVQVTGNHRHEAGEKAAIKKLLKFVEIPAARPRQAGQDRRRTGGRTAAWRCRDRSCKACASQLVPGVRALGSSNMAHDTLRPEFED